MSVSRMAKPAADRRSADLPCQSSNPDVMQGCAACSLMTDQLSGGTTRRAASPSKLSHHLKPIRNRLPGSVGMLLDDGILVLSEQLRHALGHASPHSPELHSSVPPVLVSSPPHPDAAGC